MRTPRLARPVSIVRATSAAMLVVLAALLSAHAATQIKPKSRNDALIKDVDPAKLEMKGSLQLSQEQLALAGTIKPVRPELLEAQLPATLGPFSRVSMDGFTRSYGPMGVTLVKSVYESKDGRFELDVLDPGGMPFEDRLPMLPDGMEAPGENVSFLGRWAGGHEGTLKADRKLDRSIYQVRLGPRLRLTARSDVRLGAGLKDVITLIDLDALATLAPEAPPSLDSKAPGEERQ